MGKSGGVKADEGKPALALIPPLGEVELGKAMSNGLKYGKWNYLDGIDATRLLSAAKRHINAFLRGEDRASDSEVHHLGHAAASCLMVIDILARHPERDDRPAVTNYFLETAAKVLEEHKDTFETLYESEKLERALKDTENLPKEWFGSEKVTAQQRMAGELAWSDSQTENEIRKMRTQIERLEVENSNLNVFRKFYEENVLALQVAEPYSNCAHVWRHYNDEHTGLHQCTQCGVTR